MPSAHTLTDTFYFYHTPSQETTLMCTCMYLYLHALCTRQIHTCTHVYDYELDNNQETEFFFTFFCTCW